MPNYYLMTAASRCSCCIWRMDCFCVGGTRDWDGEWGWFFNDFFLLNYFQFFLLFFVSDFDWRIYLPFFFCWVFVSIIIWVIIKCLKDFNSFFFFINLLNENLLEIYFISKHKIFCNFFMIFCLWNIWWIFFKWNFLNDFFVDLKEEWVRLNIFLTF
jgi:hypothetical protein